MISKGNKVVRVSRSGIVVCKTSSGKQHFETNPLVKKKSTLDDAGKKQYDVYKRSGIGGEREDDTEDELTIDLQEILNEEYQETQRNVPLSEQDEDKRGQMLTSAIKDLLKKWADVRAMVLEWHPNQAGVSRFGDLYNDNAINYFRKILKKREKQSILDLFFNAP
ncbi:uncharacterized protein TNCV_1543641 [Trichonephila clavipes]|nr:uncharacterized protein TNCV_1543641 [Trichonephila clavipes]